MDQTFLLALVVALVVALAAIGRVVAHSNPASGEPTGETGPEPSDDVIRSGSPPRR